MSATAAATSAAQGKSPGVLVKLLKTLTDSPKKKVSIILFGFLFDRASAKLSLLSQMQNCSLSIETAWSHNVFHAMFLTLLKQNRSIRKKFIDHWELFSKVFERSNKPCFSMSFLLGHLGNYCDLFDLQSHQRKRTINELWPLHRQIKPSCK